jgi:hypothetical protein
LTPIAITHATDPAMAVGVHVPWRLMSSLAEPRAPTSVGSAGVFMRRGLPLAPTLTAEIDQPGLPLPYVAYVCFKYFRLFRCMLQLFYLDIAKVDRGMLHMLHMLQVFFIGMLQAFVQNVSSIFRRMSQSFFIWMLRMLQQYVSKYFSCFSLMLQQEIMLQVASVLFLDVSCVSHMLQKHVSMCFIYFQSYVAFMLQLFYVIRPERAGAGGWGCCNWGTPEACSS